MSGRLSAAGFLKTTSFLMVARVGGTGLGFLIQLALVRLMTPTDYGIYVVALSLAAVLSIFCAFGFPSISARFVANYQEEGDTARTAGFIRSGQLHILAASILVITGSIVLLWGSNLVSTQYQVPLLIACLTAPILAMMRFNGALSNTARRFYLTYLPDLTLRPILLVGGLAAAFLVALPMTSSTVLSVHLVAALIACCVLWIALKPCRQFGVERSGAVVENSSWRRAALPMMFVTLLTSFLADIDILLLSTLLPAEEVGIFSVCLRIMLLIEFGLQTVFQMTTPDLAEAKARDDAQSMKSAVRRAQHISFLFTLSAFIGVTALGDWVLLLFGEGFVLGYQALILLVLGQVLRSLFGPVTQILTVAGAQMRSLTSYSVALMCLIVGNAIFVPTMGIAGGAMVLTFSMVLGTMLQAHAVSRKTGLAVLRTLFSSPFNSEVLADSGRP